MSLSVLTDRITPTALSEAAPSATELEQILQAAQCAPDHGRLRPWQFLVIQGEGRRALGALMQQALAARMPESSAAELEKEAQKPLRAPLIIALACIPQDSPKIPVSEQIMAASAAAQNLQLAAHALGYGCQWKTGPAAREASVIAGLGLPPQAQIIGFMYIGGIAQPGRLRAQPDGSRVRSWP